MAEETLWPALVGLRPEIEKIKCWRTFIIENQFVRLTLANFCGCKSSTGGASFSLSCWLYGRFCWWVCGSRCSRSRSRCSRCCCCSFSCFSCSARLAALRCWARSFFNSTGGREARVTQEVKEKSTRRETFKMQYAAQSWDKFYADPNDAIQPNRNSLTILQLRIQ